MENLTFASIGIEPGDLATLKSMLKIVSGAFGDWSLVEQPERANVTFVCGLTPEQMAPMIEKLGALSVLVYCCGRGETPPEGFFTIRRPLRTSEMSLVFDEVKKRLAVFKAQSEGKAKSEAEAASKKGKDDDDDSGHSWEAWAS